MTEKLQEQFDIGSEQEKVEIAQEKIRNLKKELESVKNARLNNPSIPEKDYRDTEKLIESRIESLEEVVKRSKGKIK